MTNSSSSNNSSIATHTSAAAAAAALCIYVPGKYLYTRYHMSGPRATWLRNHTWRQWRHEKKRRSMIWNVEVWYLLTNPVSCRFTLKTTMYLYVRIDTWGRKQHASPRDKSTAESAPGRVGRGEQGETRANSTSNGGPHLELAHLRLKT